MPEGSTLEGLGGHSHPSAGTQCGSVHFQVLSDLIPQPLSGEMVSSADSWLCQITATQKARGDTHEDVARSCMEKRQQQWAESKIVACLQTLLNSITSTELTLSVMAGFVKRYGPPVIHI